jgi:hypothetical protein
MKHNPPCPDCQRLHRKLKQRRKADRQALVAAVVLLCFVLGILAGATATASVLRLKAAAERPAAAAK